MLKTKKITNSVKRVGTDLKRMAWTSMFESIFTVLFGILLIVWPNTVVHVISYVVGIYLIAKGIYRVILYFNSNGPEDFFNNELLWGVLSVLVGFIVLVMGEGIANIFRVIIGAWIIYESLVRINTSIKLNSVGVQVWSCALVLALITLVLGVVIVFCNDSLTSLIGWIMVLSGIVGIVGDTIFVQYVNMAVEKFAKKEK